MNPTFFADMHGEAIWGALSLWTLTIAGILLIIIINKTLWTYFGLIGGGMYLYFAGRGVASQLTMQRHGIQIGRSKKLRIKYMILTLWGFIVLYKFLIVTFINYLLQI